MSSQPLTLTPHSRPTISITSHTMGEEEHSKKRCRDDDDSPDSPGSDSLTKRQRCSLDNTYVEPESEHENEPEIPKAQFEVLADTSEDSSSDTWSEEEDMMDVDADVDDLVSISEDDLDYLGGDVDPTAESSMLYTLGIGDGGETTNEDSSPLPHVFRERQDFQTWHRETSYAISYWAYFTHISSPREMFRYLAFDAPYLSSDDEDML